MERIRNLEVHDGERVRRIALYAGDLSRLPAEHAVDLLVVSAFPQSYQPVPGTLIGALRDAGLSLAELARDKAEDLRETSAFWLSKPLSERHASLHVGRIACFEPLVLGQPPQVVGELFRGLFPFLDQTRDATVAMPLLGAGNQNWPPEAILAPLLDAAHHWLSRSMPIAELKIVEIRSDRIANLAAQFDALAHELPRTGTQPGRKPVVTPEPEPSDATRLPRPETKAASGTTQAATPELPAFAPADSADGFDVFLSYAEEDQVAAQSLAAALRSQVDGVRIFDYRLSIDVGKSWQQEIDEAIESCRLIVALLSPDYFSSPECKEELMIARLRNKRSNFEVLFPLYWRDTGTALALWIQATSYSDCREGDGGKLAAQIKRLAARLH